MTEKCKHPGEPVPIDLLVATANEPTLTGEPPSYAAPEAIAAWRSTEAVRNDVWRTFEIISRKALHV